MSLLLGRMWLLLSGLFASPEISVDGLTPEEVERALAGDVVKRTETFTTPEGKSAGRGIGAIVIERSVDETWATLSRLEDRTDYIPRLKRVTVLDREGNRILLRQEIDSTVTTTRYTAWFELDVRSHSIRWKMEPRPDNTIKDVEGGYRLHSIAPQRTLLTYRSYVDTGLHVAQRIQDYVARRSIPDLLKSLKLRVESAGTWKKN